ncbi:DUF397 domain-containing protein [Streptomyces capillispiralis]|uniref:Uncharacterized protein DUF397 n=1 Tax=Streptomyces capillispiralis TaxID=68182 RepID=A0A561THW2_9ACTN|nr:DUF397 domain-containing protein [Streptomyces capillispiralis]TWF86716.1 uncharacterized protein DUF397 [Streptomyces capillispiralis]GHH90879.1 hypothetical protein GCM10017779_13360 [Streptomyces capillispiralis]
MEQKSRPDQNHVVWCKSSYSNQAGGDCVEVADGFPGAVPVRDSKNPHGPALHFRSASWVAFVGELKAGRHRM